MLPAAIRATRDVQLKLLLKSGNPLIQLFRKPARKAFRLGQRQLAKFRTRASNRAARKSGSTHRQADRGQFARDSRGLFIRDVHNQQFCMMVLRKMPIGIAVGEIGSRAQLLRRGCVRATPFAPT